MTKLKSKKMTKSTFAIIIMAVIMVAMLAFGGTYAYFTATAGEIKSDELTTARVKLGVPTITTVANTTLLLPGQPITTAPISIANESNVDTYVFVTVSIDVTKGNEAVVLKNKAGAELTDAQAFGFGISDAGTGFTKFVELDGQEGVYWSRVNADTTSANFVNSLTLSADVHSQSTTTAEGDAMTATVVITVTANSIQATGFNDAAAAYAQL